MYTEVTARIAEQHIADLRHEAEVHRLIARHGSGWSWSRLLHRSAPGPTPGRPPVLRVITGGSTTTGTR